MASNYRVRASGEARKSNSIHTIGIEASEAQVENESRLKLLDNFIVTHNVRSMWRGYHALFIAEVGLNAPVIQPLADEIFQRTNSFTMVISVGIYTVILYMATKIITKNWYAHSDNHIELAISLADTEGSKRSAITLENDTRNSLVRSKLIAYSALLGTSLFIVLLILLRIYMNSGHTVWFDYANPFNYGLVLGSFLLFFFMIRLGKHNHQYQLFKAAKRTVTKGKKYLERLRNKCKSYEQSCATLLQKAQSQNEPTYPDKDTEVCMSRLKSVAISNEDYFTKIQDQRMRVRLVVVGIPKKNVQVVAVTAEGVQLYEYTNDQGVCDISWRSGESFLKNLTVNGIHVPGTMFHSHAELVIDLAILTRQFQLLPDDLKQFSVPTPSQNGTHKLVNQEL